jgi:MFS family permease
VIAIRTTDRIGKGIRAAPRDAIVAHAVDARMRGRAFGFHRMMDNTGAVVGPMLAFALAGGLGWSLRAIFAAALVPGLFAVATVALGVHEGRADKERDVPRIDAASSPAVLPSRLRAYLAVVFLFTLGASADSFLMLRLSDLGLEDAWLPLAWVSLSAAKAVTNVPGGRISDRFGRRRTQVAGWLLYAIAYALLPMTRSIAVTWALLVLYGLHAVTGAAILPANALFGFLYTTHAAWAFGVGAACACFAAIALSRLEPLHADARP